MIRKKIISSILSFSLVLSLLLPISPVMGAPGDPGKIEAESYSAMSGIQTEASTEGGLNVSYIDAGDWMDYAVNVQSAGTYNVDFRVASPYAATQLQLRSGSTTLATVTVPNTGGYQTWQTVTASVTLPAGAQTLRVYAVTNGWNLNWLSLTSDGTIPPANGNLALNKSAFASSAEGAMAAAGAVDGNSGTRWSSLFADPQWIYVDLGSVTTVNRVKLNWEAAYGKAYQIQLSNDAAAWSNVYSTATGDGGIDDVTFTAASARYVRIYGTQRATAYGFSLWDFEVYGNSTPVQQVSAPTFTPSPGTYSSAQSVTLVSATPGATIRYTTDGSTPTLASPAYTGPINVASSTTIKAIAIKSGMTDSVVTTGTYTISTGQQQPGAWKLVWNDEFNGAAGTGVDTSKWTYETGGGGFGNGELQYYTDRTNNVYLEQDPADANNRFLVIKALQESYGNQNYTSGRIKTQNKYSFKYGKFEMKAKLPQGQGIWPAFWMLGDDLPTAGWPNSGEIDIMEFVGHTPTNVYGTIHGPGYSGGTSLGTSYTYPAGFSNAFHTYAIEWEPNVIRWYFDGQLYQTRTIEDLAGRTWPFDHNFFLLLNLAVGGAWPGSPDASTVFPQKYTVDYVRVYQREGGVYPPHPVRNIVSIQGANGLYVSADNYNNSLLTASRQTASTWEKFELIDAGSGKVALLALMNYKYASAGAGGNGQITANQSAIGPSETFQRINNADGTISLRSDANGKYVTANGANPLTASATAIGANEKFRFGS
ncbi:Glucan endo-1,3-beta-D-glucosidase [Paenibacillus curdlanolyticus YK9]|uniref:Glucan endo-1,3-beta-D-glucosidase n=1 Tax=Paenibacillus curdlanolyticus YK9 TaxID=717606 RepID=E0I5J6_9BACL|nr:family 16 glycosylhydrolase [Paenibacillus curdlanolyticus]EFM12238.1 Glucan endo-1,3-beta-D-glucosidase [Paenibacillus curdlanolyticus YK9]